MHKWSKKLYDIFCVLVMILIITQQPSTAMSEYSVRRISLHSASKIMPTIDSLPLSKEIVYRYKKTPFFMPFWYAQTMLLSVKYDKKTFLSELEKINNEYIYLPRKVNINPMPSNGEITEVESVFSINNYDFRIIKVGHGCPNEFGLIGVSEEKNNIVYLYFYDFDLDYIVPPMSDFVEEYFDYSWK